MAGPTFHLGVVTLLGLCTLRAYLGTGRESEAQVSRAVRKPTNPLSYFLRSADRADDPMVFSGVAGHIHIFSSTSI